MSHAEPLKASDQILPIFPKKAEACGMEHRYSWRSEMLDPSSAEDYSLKMTYRKCSSEFLRKVHRKYMHPP